MQLGLPFQRVSPSATDVIQLGGHPVPVRFVRTRRARHYILRVSADGALRVTVPWHGSRAEALRFVAERHEWVVRERYQRTLDAVARRPWRDGTRVLFRGEECALGTSGFGEDRVWVAVGEHRFSVPAALAGDLRRPVEDWMRRVAGVDLPARVASLAAVHGFVVKAVSVRGQRSRWGSCSSSGRISLNWRLIQLPAVVVDYVVLHELVHLHHLNHSRRFWDEVAALCPDYRAARQWLRQFKHVSGGDS